MRLGSAQEPFPAVIIINPSPFFLQEKANAFCSCNWVGQGSGSGAYPNLTPSKPSLLGWDKA